MSTTHPLIDALRHSRSAAVTARGMNTKALTLTPRHITTLVDHLGWDRFDCLTAHDDNVRSTPMPPLLRRNLIERDRWRASVFAAITELDETAQRDLIAAIANGTASEYAAQLQARADELLAGTVLVIEQDAHAAQLKEAA